MLVMIVATPIVVELARGERSPSDLALMAVLALAAAVIWVSLGRSASALADAMASREEVRRRLAQQRAVSYLSQLALADVARQELLDTAAQIVAAELFSDFAAVLELQPDRSLAYAASVGWTTASHIPGGPDSHAGYAVAVGEPVIMVDAAQERRFTPCAGMAAHGITSGLCAPIGSNGGTWGVVGAHVRDRRAFSTDDAAFIAAVANVLMSALAREAAETAADASRRVLEAVIEGTSDDIFVKDLDGRFVIVNGRAAASLGWAREEMIGRSLHDLLPKSVADIMTASDAETIELGEVKTYEEPISVDGSARVFLTTKGPYRGRDGTLLGTFGIARDITARKLQEDALARSEERFRLAQEGAQMGTWDIDLVSGKTTWSNGFRAIAGLGPDYPAGYAHLEPLIHADDREAVSECVLRAYAVGEPFEFEFRLVRPDGEIRWIFARSSCVRDENGKPTRHLGVSVDVTERRLAEQQLLLAREERVQLESRLHQAEKLEAVGRLAGGVAHDFNNLLVAIRGYGELALRRSGDVDPEVGSYLRSSLAAADRAAGLTKQLLAFARRQVLHFEVLDLNDVVAETDSLLDRVIGDHIDLVTLTAERPVIVRADRGQLEQVLVNLAVNARDAMPGGGTVTVRVGGDESGSHALLSVCDDGSGIDPAVAERIFEPFFTTKSDEGTGLGLATVHGIVTQSGGEISVDSVVGAGTTFTVSLPVCDEAPPAPAEVAPLVSEHGTEVVLVVEDDATVRSIISTMLEAHGYDVIEAASGDEAIAAFTAGEDEIPIVVSDLMMPRLDGQQTLERIRSLRPETKALFMSGYTDGMILRSDALGAGTGFIEKPFTAGQLAARVRELLDAAVPVAA